ncbi:hypothetical protein CR205_08560 [Alteribacter lacisalsi]|uniref:Thiamine-binding protein domain-containing protein n=2 Tax=Alteribacter lacisalsi TaxID=2045244 RepID=A0A2W0HCM2_9BACI|nr:hypothetical protein CR205_08560 [Alteribacter lacisalsi]
MIRGLSFNKGVFFMGRRYISCASEEKGRTRSWIKPISFPVMIGVSWKVVTSMPIWFHLAGVLILLLTVFPQAIFMLNGNVVLAGGLPLGTLILFAAGTHFYFPGELKKYHGAEHKVFSFRGRVSLSERQNIAGAEITNRHCSTNAIVLYFTAFFLLTPFLLGLGFTGRGAVDAASALALVIMPAAAYWLNRTSVTVIHRFFLRISYFLQRYVTTSEPEERHLRTAIRSYRRLAFKEFPHKVKGNRKTIYRRKGRAHMVTADVSIIPVGKGTTSESEQIAEIEAVLNEYEGRLTYKVNAMSTVIDAELPVLFEVIERVHELPFKSGVERVATHIRIDDRRDKAQSMTDKEKSVNEKISR